MHSRTAAGVGDHAYAPHPWPTGPATVDGDRLGVRPRPKEAVRGTAIFFDGAAGPLDLP